MPGGLLQIASSGIQDIYLTKTPEITFFKKVYRRHTNFSSETIEINIEQFPKHKKIMQKWLSISAERHKIFEENIMAKDRHKLDLSNYYSGKIKSKDNKSKLSSEVITQIKQLNDLYKAGVLTKEEFAKAKKKLLN